METITTTSNEIYSVVDLCKIITKKVITINGRHHEFNNDVFRSVYIDIAKNLIVCSNGMFALCFKCRSKAELDRFASIYTKSYNIVYMHTEPKNMQRQLYEQVVELYKRYKATTRSQHINNFDNAKMCCTNSFNHLFELNGRNYLADPLEKALNCGASYMVQDLKSLAVCGSNFAYICLEVKK